MKTICIYRILLLFLTLIETGNALKTATRKEEDSELDLDIRLPKTNLQSIPTTTKTTTSGSSASSIEWKNDSKQEEDQQEHVPERKERNQNQLLLSPSLFTSIAVLSIASIGDAKSLFKIIKDIIPKSFHILAIAWLPVLVLNASWIEYLSFATLLVQPSIRSFLIQEVLPDMWKSMKKLALTEAWRRLWASIMAPLPKPLFTPIAKDYNLPKSLQTIWGRVNEVVDKFTQSLVRKSVEESVYESIGMLYESMSNSMLEISIMYEDSSSKDDEDSFSSMDNNDDSNYNESDDLCCDGDSCSLNI